GREPRARASGSPRARDPRHRAGRGPHPGAHRGGRLRRLPPPPRAAGARLAARARAGAAVSAAEAAMTPEQYCQDKAAASGSSFYYSFLFLPEDRRRAITALYAFCREVDDVVDETSDAQVAAAKLAWWRAEVAGMYGGK